MAMFDDPKKELKKLEEQLLQDEEWLERELSAARSLIGDEPARMPRKNTASTGSMEQTRVYPKSGSDVRGSADMQNKAKKVVVPRTDDYDLDEVPRKKNRGLVILAIIETLGIVAVVAYWLKFLL